jgi:hypothetical protein
MEKKNKRTEELDNEGWTSDLEFYVAVTGCLNTLLTKSYKAKINPLKRCLTASKVFKIMNLVHFPHLKSLETIFPEHTQEYSKSIFLL